MLQFTTSLSFLYAFTAIIMIGYGLVYYRNFVRHGYQRRLFPWVFLLITAACFSFLWFMFHAPAGSRTCSNLDHHFIRHDGYRVAKQAELGRTDTVNTRENPFNSFRIIKENSKISVISDHSEEPFYVTTDGLHKLASANWPAGGHSISFGADSFLVKLLVKNETEHELYINNKLSGRVTKIIKRGISTWNLFQDDTLFLNSAWYTNEKIGEGLRNIQLLRTGFSDKETGELKFFLSARIFSAVASVFYDNKTLASSSLAFSSPAEDNSQLGWGLGYPGRNKNQYLLRSLSADSFRLVSKYPVSYPLTEEKVPGQTANASKRQVIKFLVSDPRQIKNMPAVFNEGFLFSAFPGDSTTGFSPVVLSYQKDRAGSPVNLQFRPLVSSRNSGLLQGNKLLLGSQQPGLTWEFSLVDSFNWQLGNRSLPAAQWKLLIFGSLLFFFAVVFFSSWLKPADQLSWVWQVLSSVVMVLLTTRFFLYWRYKSFPPYEGLDLPSVQQLNSFWNFGIIVLVTLLLGIVFGYGLFSYISRRSRQLVKRLTGKQNRYSNGTVTVITGIEERMNRLPFVKKAGTKLFFWGSWLLILVAGASVAVMSHFSPAVCRHLAIALVLLYFLFSYIAAGFSPLVASSGKSWWGIDTSKRTELIISNPVRLLLSLSLLGLFSFIDIGFALVFLNFLLFNEAFLFINYSIAGLSAGSRGNAALFGLLGVFYLLVFAANLVYGPYIFRFLLELPQWVYSVAYLLFAILISYAVGRLLHYPVKRKRWLQLAAFALLFGSAFAFFPKEKIREKAAMTQYRIDVLTMPAAQAIEKAFRDGDGYEPVIRAAQNQWFINTFIDKENNPSVNKAGFQLLPHAPQNRGAKYNAQATDLVTSRFLLAEHGRWSVLFYVLLLLLPVSLLASFYKLYPDFTNRINPGHAAVTTGFAVLNYILITALLVILAATGRYIFFGQDLPFGSILSKQSILFPSLLIIAVVLFFNRVPLQRYSNRKKLMPGFVVFSGLVVLLFFVQPVFNRGRDFGVADLAGNMDGYIEARIQPVWEEIDSARQTRKLPLSRKDKLFAGRLKEMWETGSLSDAPAVLQKQLQDYFNSGFTRHLDANRMLYLDMNSGKPVLAVNDNYFHVEAPPHLQQLWRGNIFSDTSGYNISMYNGADGSVSSLRLDRYSFEGNSTASNGLEFSFNKGTAGQQSTGLCLINRTGYPIELVTNQSKLTVDKNDTAFLRNPSRVLIRNSGTRGELLLAVQPDAFMQNYHVNGSRFYHYPLGSDFIWARNFAEGIASGYAGKEKMNEHVFISLNASLTDSLSGRISRMLDADTSYKPGAEYAICIADGKGRILAMPDHIKGFQRPDPNDKAAFSSALRGEAGFISQSDLRKKIGNINLLRMNPGPGSTLKPIVFASIASQLDLDWDAFAAEGFSEKQEFFGGEKVAEYDFEKNNGRISTVVDYIKYSDNYYHSNLLLLGSYTRQGLQALLLNNFMKEKPEGVFHWPYFSYKGQQYWLNGFEHWPGYASGKANFGSDSSFVSAGLFSNFGIHTYRNGRSFDRFMSQYDSAVFGKSYTRSGFILPEYALFDQKGTGMNLDRPNEVFLSSFRGHVKGSSQVMLPPLKMLDAFGKLASQNRNYSLTLDPYAEERPFSPFSVDGGVTYSKYLSLVKESVFRGLKEALYSGTAARLGGMLKNGSHYFYYAKTGTTGDDELKAKSKLFTIIISKKDIASPDFNFRKNPFITIYFTSQKGPAKQNEEFQASIIRMVEQSPAVQRYLSGMDQ